MARDQDEGSAARDRPALFRRFPALRGTIPWTALGELPTPVAHMASLGEHLGRDDLWVKRDDLSSCFYGGNKVRKLEFTLADAQRRGKNRVITVGAVGSNHVLATAVHARRLGLQTTAVLVPQPVQANLRSNLLSLANQGACLVPVSSGLMVPPQIARLTVSELRRSGRSPYLLWVGGSSFTGVLGYVDCALELEQQVAAGLLPEPTHVVMPVGTAGTLAGLAAGLRLTTLKTVPVGVSVFGRSYANEAVASFLANSVLSRLRRLDPSVPRRRVGRGDLVMRHDFFGRGYARYTRRGVEAMQLFAEHEGIGLEGTYSGKAAAAFVDRVRRPLGRQGPLLFLATYNSAPADRLLAGAPDPNQLPPPLRRYFTDPIAAVDEG